MRRFVLLLPLVALALTGCGDPPPLPMAATPDSSRSALVSALDGWKAGKSPKELLDGSPSLIFMDDEASAGSKLLDYKIEKDGEVRGTGYSYVVTLSLQDKEGHSRTRKVAYTAVSSPQLAVTKEDRQP